MDLGIRGRSALVCAASKGLGRACAESLAREGVSLTLCARGAEALDATANDLRTRYGVPIQAVAIDITTDAGRSAVLAACPAPDILVNTAGGPPLRDFRTLQRGDWEQALNANMLTPIEMIKAVLDGMIDRKFGRIVNITSGAVKAPPALFDLSSGARAGLTGFVAGIARQSVRHNVTINNLLPGLFDTDRIRSGLPAIAAKRGITLEQVLDERQRGIPAGRMGIPAEFGDACAWLCSAQAGYVTGQNLLLDGGAYPGIF
ncbi:MAG: SDR family oxidoreductase [Gammaproteobacteria bacterium]|nr:SDR family oxidoreductase [Gammaproteobacteria bacterium]